MPEPDLAECVDGVYVTKEQCEKYRDELKKVVIEGNEKICGTITVHDQQAKRILDNQTDLKSNIAEMQKCQVETVKHLSKVAENQSIALETQRQLSQLTQQNAQIIQWMQGVISQQNKRTADAMWRLLLILTALSVGLLYLHQTGAL